MFDRWYRNARDSPLSPAVTKVIMTLGLVGVLACGALLTLTGIGVAIDGEPGLGLGIVILSLALRQVAFLGADIPKGRLNRYYALLGFVLVATIVVVSVFGSATAGLLVAGIGIIASRVFSLRSRGAESRNS